MTESKAVTMTQILKLPQLRLTTLKQADNADVVTKNLKGLSEIQQPDISSYGTTGANNIYLSQLQSSSKQSNIAASNIGQLIDKRNTESKIINPVHESKQQYNIPKMMKSDTKDIPTRKSTNAYMNKYKTIRTALLDNKIQEEYGLSRFAASCAPIAHFEGGEEPLILREHISKYRINSMQENLVNAVTKNIYKEVFQADIKHLQPYTKTLSNICFKTYQIIASKVSKLVSYLKNDKELVIAIIDGDIFTEESFNKDKRFLELVELLNENDTTTLETYINDNSNQTACSSTEVARDFDRLMLNMRKQENKNSSNTHIMHNPMRRVEVEDENRFTEMAQTILKQSLVKNIVLQVVISVTHLRDSLNYIKYPRYNWPSGDPRLPSKLRRVEEMSSIDNIVHNPFIRRLLTFIDKDNPEHPSWPDNQLVRPGPIASAGFSYEGNADKVVCESCRFKSDVSEWSDDDEDYALSVHMQSRNRCDFLNSFGLQPSNSYSNEDSC